MNSVSPKYTLKIIHFRSKSFESNIIFCYARQKRSKSWRIYEYFNKAEQKIWLSKPDSSLNTLARVRIIMENTLSYKIELSTQTPLRRHRHAASLVFACLWTPQRLAKHFLRTSSWCFGSVRTCRQTWAWPSRAHQLSCTALRGCCQTIRPSGWCTTPAMLWATSWYPITANWNINPSR